MTVATRIRNLRAGVDEVRRDLASLQVVREPVHSVGAIQIEEDGALNDPVACDIGECIESGGVFPDGTPTAPTVRCPQCESAPLRYFFNERFTGLNTITVDTEGNNCVYRSPPIKSGRIFDEKTGLFTDFGFGEWVLDIGGAVKTLTFENDDGDVRIEYTKHGPWCCLCTTELVLDCHQGLIARGFTGEFFTPTVCVMADLGCPVCLEDTPKQFLLTASGFTCEEFNGEHIVAIADFNPGFSTVGGGCVYRETLEFVMNLNPEHGRPHSTVGYNLFLGSDFLGHKFAIELIDRSDRGAGGSCLERRCRLNFLPDSTLAIEDLCSGTVRWTNNEGFRDPWECSKEYEPEIITEAIR